MTTLEKTDSFSNSAKTPTTKRPRKTSADMTVEVQVENEKKAHITRKYDTVLDANHPSTLMLAGETLSNIKFHLRCHHALTLKKQLERILKPKYLKTIAVVLLQVPDKEQVIMRLYSSGDEIQNMNATFSEELWSHAWIYQPQVVFFIKPKEFLEQTALDDITTADQCLEWIMTENEEHIFHIPSHHVDALSKTSRHSFDGKKINLIGENASDAMEGLLDLADKTEGMKFYTQVFPGDIWMDCIKSMEKNRTDTQKLHFSVTRECIRLKCNTKVQSLHKTVDEEHWPGSEENGTSQKIESFFNITLLKDGNESFYSGAPIQLKFTKFGDIAILYFVQSITCKHANIYADNTADEFIRIERMLGGSTDDSE